MPPAHVTAPVRTAPTTRPALVGLALLTLAVGPGCTEKGEGGSGGGSGGAVATGGSGGARTGGSSGGQATGGSPGSGGTPSATGGNGSSGSPGQGGTAGSPGQGGTAGSPTTDGGGSETPPAGEPGPGFTGWKYSKSIKLDTSPAGAGVMGDVDNYPVAIVLTAMNFDFAQAKDKGEDLRFGKADGSPLPYHVEHWDKASQTAAAWVKVDKVLGNNATQSINMYWGKADATDGGDSKKVFDTTQGFIAVWHLADDGGSTAGGYKDASGNEAHATGVALDAMAAQPGRIGRATKLVNEMSQWVRLDGAKLPLFDTQNKMTISIWTKVGRFVGRAPIGYDTIFSKGDSAWTIQRLGRGSTMETCVRSGGHLCAIGKTQMMTGETAPWYHVTAVLDHPQLRYYTNGAADGTASGGGAWGKGVHPVGIGVQTQYVGREPRFWDGLVDEARVMSVAKDANWIKLEYESQKADSKFLTFGATATR